MAKGWLKLQNNVVINTVRKNDDDIPVNEGDITWFEADGLKSVGIGSIRNEDHWYTGNGDAWIKVNFDGTIHSHSDEDST